MGIFDNMRARQKSRRKRRSKRQTARQARRQTRAEGRFSPEAVAGRQALFGQLGGQALGMAGSLLGADSAMAAYTGADGGDMGGMGYVDDGGGGMDPIMIGVGVLALGALVMMMAKK